jgi:hypothetical protein
LRNLFENDSKGLDILKQIGALVATRGPLDPGHHAVNHVEDVKAVSHLCFGVNWETRRGIRSVWNTNFFECEFTALGPKLLHAKIKVATQVWNRTLVGEFNLMEGRGVVVSKTT